MHISSGRTVINPFTLVWNACWGPAIVYVLIAQVIFLFEYRHTVTPYQLYSLIGVSSTMRHFVSLGWKCLISAFIPLSQLASANVW